MKIIIIIIIIIIITIIIIIIIVIIIRKNVRGRAEGNLDLLIVNMGLKGELEKLAAQCESASDLEVSCYCTNLPNKLPVTIDGLLKLIETFPSTLQEINMGRGIPIAVRPGYYSPSHLVQFSSRGFGEHK